MPESKQPEPKHALTRESILNDTIREHAERRPDLLEIMPDEERNASLAAMLEAAPTPREIWVFGYGSLIWNPAFHYAERQASHLYGFHRRFCLWSLMGRGCERNPGLMLGLMPGGSCRGIAYRIAPDQVASELDILWRREMFTGAYRPVWVRLRAAQNVLHAITFVVDPNHQRCAGRLDDETVVRHISVAEGPLGRGSDYLFQTADHLRELGLEDPHLGRLARMVREAHAAPNC